MSEFLGLHKVNRKLANGAVAVHYYAWRGGPKIEGEYGSEEFKASFDEGVKSVFKGVPVKPKTLMALLRMYQDSAEFLVKLSPTSRADYEYFFEEIEQTFGHYDFRMLQLPAARTAFLEWRDTKKEHPRTADYCITVLAIILAWGKHRGILAQNVLLKPGKLYKPDRKDFIWTPEDVEAIKLVAKPYLRTAMEIALWTGQRQGDCLRMKWSAYNGKTIAVKQGKTKTEVCIPVSAELKLHLDAVAKERLLHAIKKLGADTPEARTDVKRLIKNSTIITTEKGEEFTSDGFRTAWWKLTNKAGLRGQGLTFHDMRGTMVTKLATAGASEIEIAAITGHSLGTVRTMLDKHYLSRNAIMAANGMAKLEAALAAQKLAKEQGNGTVEQDLFDSLFGEE